MCIRDRSASASTTATRCSSPAASGRGRAPRRDTPGPAPQVDGLYGYDIRDARDAAAGPWLANLAGGYTDPALAEAYVRQIESQGCRPLVAALTRPDGPPVALALVAAACRHHGRRHCCCAHLGIWALVVPSSERGKKHGRRGDRRPTGARRCHFKRRTRVQNTKLALPRRLAAAVRVHAACHGASRVLVLVANPAEHRRLFLKLGFAPGGARDDRHVPSLRGFWVGEADPARRLS